MPQPLALTVCLSLILVLAASCGGGGGGTEDSGGTSTELVRFKVSALTGTEPLTFTSTSHPALFVLDPSIASVSVTHFNENSPPRPDTTPATFRPSMTPVPPHTTASMITLTIVPNGSLVSYGSITFTTSAEFPSNPTSLRLQTSEDSFTSTLSTIVLDMERTATLPLTTTPTSSLFEFRWVAGNDFGAFGGGAAGFSSEDLVVRD